MKKLIKILLATMFSSATTSSIIACTNPFVDPNVLRVTIVTDGHPVNDNSFNESSYDGAMRFKDEFEAWTDKPDELKNKKVVITPIMPTTIDENTFVQSYGQSVVMDSVATIASGFVQNAALIRSQNTVLKHLMRYIYVDGDTPDDVVPNGPNGNKNLAGLLYSAEQSGLMAAIAGAVWLIANNQQYGGLDDYNLKMSTYGGLNIAAVTSYMYGFFWGINLINNSEQYGFNTELENWVKKINPNVNLTKLPKIKFVDLPSQFTGNFNQASPSSKALNTSLVNKGTNIIFPVAGPQTSDTLAALENKSKGKVIGVDTDQRLQYSESADRFITSALKEITYSVNYMLWRAIGYSTDDNNPNKHEKLSEEEINNIFKENAPYQGGPKFVGIAKNPAIELIYDDIINSNNLIDEENGFLVRVSKAWQDVLSSQPSDLWVKGQQVNPFN